MRKELALTLQFSWGLCMDGVNVTPSLKPAKPAASYFHSHCFIANFQPRTFSFPLSILLMLNWMLIAVKMLKISLKSASRQVETHPSPPGLELYQFEYGWITSAPYPLAKKAKHRCGCARTSFKLVARVSVDHPSNLSLVSPN